MKINTKINIAKTLALLFPILWMGYWIAFISFINWGLTLPIDWSSPARILFASSLPILWVVVIVFTWGCDKRMFR